MSDARTCEAPTDGWMVCAAAPAGRELQGGQCKRPAWWSQQPLERAAGAMQAPCKGSAAEQPPQRAAGAMQQCKRACKGPAAEQPPETAACAMRSARARGRHVDPAARAARRRPASLLAARAPASSSVRIIPLLSVFMTTAGACASGTGETVWGHPPSAPCGPQAAFRARPTCQVRCGVVGLARRPDPSGTAREACSRRSAGEAVRVACALAV